MILIKINDFEFSAIPNSSILEACKLVGVHIPRFCYHELLSVSGNCRMCLVEIENIEKPVASCVTEVSDGMSIYSNTAFVQKARENVIETLLLNHPLDCPICDQAGECDLQDQVKKNGSNYTRYFFKKKSVENKYCGPLIKTIMTRCITCTRCVRYSTEIAGTDFYGTLNRGNNTEISSYIPNFFNSEISGNVIDLCPVGALNSAPHSSTGRPWEFRIGETIDLTDSLHSNIYVNYRTTYLYKILPKINNDINDSLISDRIRYIYDSNSRNRIKGAYSLSNVTPNKTVKIGWKKFFPRFDNLLKSNKITFVIDDKLDLESVSLLKKVAALNPNTVEIESLYSNNIGNYYVNLNTNFFKLLEKIDTSIIFLGTNPKIENTVLNAKIRIKIKNNLINLFTLGLSYNYNFFNNYINLNCTEIFKSIDGKVKILANSIYKSSFFLVIVGTSLKERISNSFGIYNSIAKIFSNSIILSLGLNANSETFNLMHFKKASYLKNTKNNISFFINTETNSYVKKIIKASNKKIYFNSILNKWKNIFNFILPSMTNFEKEKTYLNLEHRSQKTSKIVEISTGCKDFTHILISAFNLNENLRVNSFNSSFNYIKEIVYSKHKYNDLFKFNQNMIFNTNKLILLSQNDIKISKYPLSQEITNFYYKDDYSKNSQIMQNCATEFKNNFNNFFK